MNDPTTIGLHPVTLRRPRRAARSVPPRERDEAVWGIALSVLLGTAFWVLVLILMTN